MRPEECDVLATDLDRTVTRADLTVDPRCIQAIRRLREAGVPCVVVTGRSLADLVGGAVPLVFDAYALEGGAMWGLPGAWRYAAPSGLDEAAAALERAGVPFVRRAASLSAPLEAEEVLTAVPQVGVHRNWTHLDVLPGGHDKGTGLRKALEILGRQPATVCAIGDGDNDVPLLRAANARVAVGNSSPRLKAEADLIVAAYGDGFLEIAARMAASRDKARVPNPGGTGT